MKESPFIGALKIGAKKINSDITLDQIIEEIKGDFPYLTKDIYKRMFATWFFLKFDVLSNYTDVRDCIKRGDRKALLDYAKKPVKINGEGYAEYLDYIKLRHARLFSLCAIGIAIATMIFTAIAVMRM